MSAYLQGENITLFASFYDGLGTPIVSGVSQAYTTVYHFNGPTLVYDLISGTMTQQPTPFENFWYYNYSIPNAAFVTNYNVIYSAVFSGTNLQTSEVFSVLPVQSSFPSSYGQGSVAASGVVVGISGIGINSASVVVSSGQTTWASATTDVSGNYVVFLNPGQYLFSFYAAGYYPTQTLEPIPSGTMWNVGTQQMNPSSQGSLTISDTFVYVSPTNVTYYLSNFKVQLNRKLDSADTPPYAIAYTDVSGTFVTTADPGLYVMTVQGELWNTVANKNDRYNYTYDIEVDSVWSGTGISGTSSPYNFQYLDTSRYNYT